MNLWARKTGLMILSALLFFSCEKDELSTIGLPPENELGIFFVEIPLENATSQVWINDISSLSSGIIFAGEYMDPDLGMISGQSFGELVLPSANPGKLLGEDATLDSIVMELRMTRAFGVNLASTSQTIELYQLLDTIPTFEQSYYNNSEQPVGMKLGEKSFMIYPDSLDLLFSDTDLPDSADERSLYDADGRYIYKTNIRVDDAFAQQFFTEMQDTTENSTFSDNKNFADFMNGLRVNGVPGNSAVIGYTPTNQYTGMKVYYTETVEGQPVQKSLRFTYNSLINYNNVTPNADVDWSGGDLDGLNSFYTPFETESSKAYIQSGTNLYLKLDMSIFREFADTLQNPIIQKAQLFIESPEIISDDNTRLPSPSILNATVTSLDSLESGYYRSTQDIPTDLPSTMQYDDDQGLYKVEFPVYLQSVVENNNEFDQIIISPVTTNIFTGSLKQDNSSLNKLAVDKSNIKIRLYYTIPDSN